MAKPYDFSTALMVPRDPTLSPKAQARKEQQDIERRRRELLSEKQTFDARKREQFQNELRRQDYRKIDQMQFPKANPIQYKNTVPTVELSQAPLVAPAAGEAMGGPETPTPRWAQAPAIEEDQPAKEQPRWMQAPAIDEPAEPQRVPTNEMDAMIEETAAAVPGGYKAFAAKPADPERMKEKGYVRDPLAKSGYAKPREADLFDKAAADPASVNSPEKPWNESVADILDAGADFLLAPLDARDTGGDDPLGAVAKSVARGTAEAPGLLARDPNQFVETYDPFHQLARGYNATVDLGGDLIEGDVSQALPKASKAVTETLGGVLGLTGLGGVVKPKPGAAAVKQAPVRQPSVRETGKTLATTVLPTSAIRPQAYDAIERILLHSGVPRDRVRLGLAKVVESLKGGADSQAVGASGRQTIAQLLEREYGQEFPEVVQNLRTVLLERRLSRKAGDRSPTTIRETVQDMRGTQVPHLQESLNKNLGDASRTETRAQVAENLKQIGQEGYKPIVSQTATPERAKSIQSVLNGPGMSELGRPLRQIAAGEGVDIEDMIAQRPIEAAHWMQHKARLLAEENGDTALGNAYNSMRDRILKTIDDLTAPDGRTYAQIRKEYGDEAGIKQALTAGDRFGALVRNPDGANQFVERFKEATPEQQSAQLASIRDWADSKLRGGPEAAAGRMTELQTIAVLDTLEKLGPQGKSLADDIRALRDEEQFLGSFYPKSESATASNAVALAQGPDIYSRGAKGGASASAVADAALMGTGMTHAPLITAMQQGPKLYRGMMQPKTATREDMTRLLMARPGEKGKGVTSPAPPPPSRTVPPKGAAPTVANAEKILSNPAVARSLSEDQFKPLFEAVNDEMKRLQAKTITLSTSGERIPYTQTREGAAEADRLNKLLLNWFKGEDGAVDVEKLARWSERNDPDRVLRVQSGRVADDLRDGVEPLSPTPKPPIVKNGFGSSPLPMDEASRMARAREQGFDVDTPLYHGTRLNKKPRSIDGAQGSGSESFDAFRGPSYFSTDPETARLYAGDWADAAAGNAPQVIRAYARGRLVDVSVDEIERLGYNAQKMARLAKEGYSGARAGNQVLIFDPKNIRRTDATFDPSQSGSSKLLAGVVGTAGLGSVLASEISDDEARKRRQN